MRVKRDVVRRLLYKPRKANELYARLVGYASYAIDAALTELLREGIIGVTCKRFYIRNHAQAMRIANGE